VQGGISFGNLFDDFAGQTSKPLFLGEYGADAFNAETFGEDALRRGEGVQDPSSGSPLHALCALRQWLRRAPCIQNES